jgi:ankyrin repeat protein
MELADDDPLAIALTSALRAGDVDALSASLPAEPSLARVCIVTTAYGRGGARTLLHVLTDWPGAAPTGPEFVRTLVAAGANVDAPFIGRHSETALHWAASSDDVPVLDALLDAGANIEAAGVVIGNGTPLADAVALGQWKAARRPGGSSSEAPWRTSGRPRRSVSSIA